MERARRAAPVSACGLLDGAVTGTGSDLESYVPQEMLADLHEPRLVITPGYIGRDRRGLAPSRAWERDPPGSRWVLAVTVALITSAVVVPLTLALAPRVVPATATDRVGAHVPGRGPAVAAAPGTRRTRPTRAGRSHGATRPKPSANCDQSTGSSVSPHCLRRQLASQRRQARAAERASRSEERSAARAAARAARAAARAARIAAKHPAGAPAP